MLQKLGLLALNSLDDELIIVREIEHGATCTWIAKFTKRLIANGDLRIESIGRMLLPPLLVIS